MAAAMTKSLPDSEFAKEFGERVAAVATGDALRRTIAYFLREWVPQWHNQRRLDATEELVSETRCRMMRQESSYKEDGRFLAWARSVARHVVLEHVRDVRKRAASDDLSGCQDPGMGCLDVLNRSEEEQVVQRCMALLSPRQQELISAQFQKTTSRQLAEKWGIKPGTVRQQQSRAFQELCTLIQNAERGGVR